jgi:N,N'-diacetyllegionaminate synthase
MTELQQPADKIRIDGKPIGAGHPCFIIAEVGVNHNGDAETARQMIDAAAGAGVDCVKFQTFSAEEFCNSGEDIYEYISQGKVVREPMLEMFRRLELRRDEFARLFDYARKRGLVPLSTPADRPAVDLLEGIGAGAFKVGSDDLVYTPFLRYVAGKGKPIIISTGMADAADIDRAVAAVTSAGNRQLAILHCVSLYPTPPQQVNLRRMMALDRRYPFPVGFSDHSFGITAVIGAVSLGARIIEKHFTLDRAMPGPDHRFSADPAELQALVRAIRDVEQNLGDGSLALTADERRVAELCHRSIVAARDIAAGETLSDADVAFKRPGAGLMPYQIDSVLGRRARRAIPAGSMIMSDMLGDPS